MTGSLLSVRQERALAITPKCTATLSIPCSIFLLYEIYCDHRRKGTNSIQRAIVGMSVVDILASSAWFLSTWAVPEGSFAYAAGNQTSCSFQGFLLQLAIGAPLYNSSLALFYTLMIKRRWTDLQLIRVERWVHGFILSFTVGTSILLLHLEQYNHIGAVCWVIGSPPDCGNSSFQESDIPCERGDYAWAWGLALFYGPLWICVIACCTSMAILYTEVRKTLNKSKSYTRNVGTRDSLRRSGRDSSRVATQAILYSLTFLITWMPSTLWSIAHWFQWSHYGLDMAAAVAEPLQGMWNLLIFMRTRPETIRKLRVALACVFPCCCTVPEETHSERESRLSGLTMSLKNVAKAFGPLAASSEMPLSTDISGIIGNSDVPVHEKNVDMSWSESGPAAAKGDVSALVTEAILDNSFLGNDKATAGPLKGGQSTYCCESGDTTSEEKKFDFAMDILEPTKKAAGGKEETHDSVQSTRRSSTSSAGLVSCLKTASQHERNDKPKKKVQLIKQVSFDNSSSRSDSEYGHQSEKDTYDVWV